MNLSTDTWLKNSVLFISTLLFSLSLVAAEESKSTETETKATEKSALSENAAAGKVLFDEAECLKCHGTEVFTRSDHKVKDLTKLAGQVSMCQQNLGIEWFPEDSEQVITYLNEAFYQFPEKKKEATDNK